MNFADFSFWWILATSGLIFLLIRYVCLSLSFWNPLLDRLGLMIISLNLLWSASPASFGIFAVELVVNYSLVRLMQAQTRWRATLLAGLTIAIDLAILIYFKYFSFLTQDVLHFSFSGQSESFSLLDVKAGEIPPGISFYTFQMVGFVVDSFRLNSNTNKQPLDEPKERLKQPKSMSLVDYVNFASFFPQVVAGPIERRGDLLPQMQVFRFKFNADNLENGLRWLALGLFMKLVISNHASALIDLGETENAWLIWLSIYFFGIRIYFDFAGYSFIAFGLARILGVTLTLNFLTPYLSCDIQEFWRRWHVTLSGWFRDYLYFPLGGNRVPWSALNVMVVFVISGLWHGAGWNFIIWGFYHGLLLLIYRYVGRSLKIPSVCGWLITFVSVMFGWLFFMEANLERLTQKLHTLMSPLAYTSDALRALQIFFQSPLNVATFLLSVGFLIGEYLARWQKQECDYGMFLSPWAARILLGSVFILAAQKGSDFIYFAF